MTKPKNKIYIKDWLYFKPYTIQCPTDSYYLRISNEVKLAIVSNEYYNQFLEDIDEEDINLMSCFITSYFEDLISETNLWNSFIKVHTRLYNKSLPFYNLDEYYDMEVNVQDISLLIWYILNTFQDKTFINPFNEALTLIAIDVEEILNREWEYAPENKDLKPYYSLKEKNVDYYEARHLIDNILFKSYLFFVDTGLNLIEKEYEIVEANESPQHLSMFLTENRDSILHSSRTQLLSLCGKEWAAEILGEKHQLYSAFLNISPKIIGYFLYKGQDSENIFLEHIASSKKFNLTKKSFEYADQITETDTIMFIGLVKWCDEWWFSGTHFKVPFNADLILDEKNSTKSRMAVNFLDHQTDKVDETLQNQFRSFLNYNNGKEIAFLTSDKINNFTDGFVKFFNNSLKLSKKVKSESIERRRKDGYFGGENEEIDFSRTKETALIFFNKKSGVEIVINTNSAFPTTSNPYFNESLSEEHILRLLSDSSISTELANYCVDNFKEKLSYFNTVHGKYYLKDLDFLLRFWKKEHYHSKPLVTFI